MKILFLLPFFALIASCSSSKNNKTSDWTEIIYKHKSGTIAPPYAYSYTINITDAGKGFLNYHQSYGDSINWTYDFTLSSEQKKELKDYISENKLASTSLNREKPDKNPIGGSTSYLTIVMSQDPNLDQKPPTIEYPAFLVDKDLAGVLKKLYKMIDGYVPAATWDEIKVKKDKYIEEHKK